jgi:hypothetical protein
MPPVLRKRKNGPGSVGATSGLEKCECGEPIIVFQEKIATVSNKEKTAKAWKEVKRALTHPETLLHTEKNSKAKSSDQQEETPVCPIGIRQCKYCLDNRPGRKGPTRARTGTRKRKHAPAEEEEAAKTNEGAVPARARTGTRKRKHAPAEEEEAAKTNEGAVPARARTGTRKRKHAPAEEEEAAKTNEGAVPVEEQDDEESAETNKPEYVPLSVEDREDDVRLPESLSDDDSEWVCFCKDN